MLASRGVSRIPYHFRYETDSGRRSRTTSKTAPLVQRTSFASNAGALWKWKPRTVPLIILDTTFAWTGLNSIPCAENSFAHQALRNRPRSSQCGAGSISQAPAMPVSKKRIAHNPNLGPPGLPSAGSSMKPRTASRRCTLFLDERRHHPLLRRLIRHLGSAGFWQFGRPATWAIHPFDRCRRSQCRRERMRVTIENDY